MLWHAVTRVPGMASVRNGLDQVPDAVLFVGTVCCFAATFAFCWMGIRVGFGTWRSRRHGLVLCGIAVVATPLAADYYVRTSARGTVPLVFYAVGLIWLIMRVWQVAES